MPQYQHYVQQAYLRRWVKAGHLFLFDKNTRKLVGRASSKRVFGELDWQSQEMETAFAEIERVVGNTDATTEIRDFQQMRKFTGWLALHLVRNGSNLQSRRGTDYRAEVENTSNMLLQWHGFWQNFQEDALITSDNPVVLIRSTTGDFFIAPLSPRRCVYVVPEDRLPMEHNAPCFSPPTLNQIMLNTAHSHCVSFDANLHLP